MILPAVDYRRTHILIPQKLPEGLDGVLNGMVGWYRRRSKYLKDLLDEAHRIHSDADALRHTSYPGLRERIQEMQGYFRRQHKDCEDLVPRAVSLLVEAADRTLGLRPFPVQVAGALALYRGFLAEMATGEGKSLTACLPAILAAWTGRPCHIVTVNDYLAHRDTVEMHPFYHLCGVSVGCVTGPMHPQERQENYAKGVVYTTSKEIVADFLRDRLIMGTFQQPSRRMIRGMLNPRLRQAEGLVMRGLDTAIVDEADSVLVDEAVTPLIISRAQENRPFAHACELAHRIADEFEPDRDYTRDIKYKEINFTKEALRRMEEMADHLPGIWRSPSRREEILTQALTAREFYRLDEQYVIQEGKVVIVDEFTGRLMPNRTWRQGLHQAVEAKEGIDLSHPSETLARLSFQQFFRLFRRLSGMTGTASEAGGEFWHIYRLPVVRIPTNRPCIRRSSPDRVFAREEEKWKAILQEIVTVNRTGRPVLVGTRSIGKSERLARMLTAEGLSFNLLNAIYHEREAAIVKEAGQEGAITIATNMAGRGTDIKLGRAIAGRGGLHVIATERHESGRIDRQLFGRCARQGDPGSVQAFMSIEDELIERFLPSIVRTNLAWAIAKKSPGAHLLAGRAVIMAQNAAQRLAFKQRKNVLMMDTWLEEALSFSGRGGM